MFAAPDGSRRSANKTGMAAQFGSDSILKPSSTMPDTNPYSSPAPAVGSPDLVIERKRMPFVLGFLGAGWFVVMWNLNYFGLIPGDIAGSSDMGVLLFIWGLAFPFSLLCLYLSVTKPAPIITVEDGQLQIRQSILSSAMLLNTSEVQYFAFESVGEGVVLVIALSGADETLKPKRTWFGSRRPNCVIVNVQESRISADEVAQQLSDLLDIPHKGRIGEAVD